MLSSDALAYQVAFAPEYLVSIELTTQFDLVLRPLPDAAPPRPETRRIPLDKPDYDPSALVIDASGTRAFVASAAGWVRSYALPSGVLQSEWRMGSAATALALSPDEQYLLIGTATGVVCSRRLRDGAQLQCLAAHRGRVSALAIHDELVASSSWQGELSLWSLPALESVSAAETRGSVADLAFSESGATLAVARNQRPPLRSPAVNEAERKSPDVDPPGANVVELWQVGQRRLAGQEPATLVGHRSIISSLSWLGDDLLSASWDRRIWLWNTHTRTRTHSLGQFRHIIRDICTWSRGGRFAAAGWATGESAPAVLWGRILY